MALYEELNEVDVFGPIHRYIKQGLLPAPKVDGRIHLKHVLDLDRTWVDVKNDLDRCCELWWMYYFHYYDIIAKECRNCWKVVVKPKTLTDLFKVSEVQHKMDTHSKSGLENREYTGNVGGYGSYWYSKLYDGLEGGRELYKWVESELKKAKLTHLKPILKRGCTEFENKYHPSSKWDEFIIKSDGKDINLTERWDRKQALLDTIFVLPEERVIVPPLQIKVYAQKRWIEYAFEHGDKTYKDYIEDYSEPVPSLEFYHDGDQKNDDFKPTWISKDESNNNRYTQKTTENSNKASKCSKDTKTGYKSGKTKNRKISVIS